MLLLESKKLAEPEPEKEDEQPPNPDEHPPGVIDDGLDTMPWPQLQKLAKKRGMKIFQKGREAVVKWVREHPEKSDA